ncbi:TPA: EamA family transporter, partial [Acinetobacter baumannii]|nr:EamA family transporter [Acinetobacter baumannii]
IWLSEQWTIYHTFGGIMILVGIIMAQKKVNSKKSDLLPEQN